MLFSIRIMRNVIRWRRLLVLTFILFIFVMVLLPTKQRAEISIKDDQYEDPVTKILRAVEPSTRSVVLPEEETAVVQPQESTSCQDLGSKQYLLFMIISSPENVERRQTIRRILHEHLQTWENTVVTGFPQYEFGSAIKALFFVGHPPNSSMDTLGELYFEAEDYGDMVYDNFSESYLNLTVKTLRMLKWVQRHCGNVRYMVKIDDDVYLNVPVLLNFLRAFNFTKDSENVIAGYKYNKIKIDSDPESKWYTPSFMWATHFPDFVSGIFYVLGSRAREDLYHYALETKLFHLEDVFLTGIVRVKHLALDVVNIPGVHVHWIFHNTLMFPCKFKESVAAAHSLSANQVECYSQMYYYCEKVPFIPIVLLC